MLEVTVLPDKGADIYAITDLGSGIDPLFKAPWGLQPPKSPHCRGRGPRPVMILAKLRCGSPSSAA
jgi:hypothetical protein